MARTLELLSPRKLDDTRVITADDIDEILTQTSPESKYPVAIGHMAAMGWPDDTAQAAGTVKNLRKSNKGALIGDVDLRDEVDQDYQDGRYVAWSAGIHRYAKETEDGLEYTPWTFGHLALLGATEAAFKDLQELDSESFRVTGKVGKKRIDDGWASTGLFFVNDKKSQKETICFSIDGTNFQEDEGEDWASAANTNIPVYQGDTGWGGNKAIKDMLDMSVDAARSGCCIYNKNGGDDSVSTYGFPFAIVENGRKYIHPKAVAAIGGALSGARGTTVSSEKKALVEPVYNRLQKKVEDSKEEQDQKLKQKDKNMEELELLKQQNQELVERLTAMEEEKRKDKLEAFSILAKGTVDKMKSLGIASDLVEKFSTKCADMAESLIDKDIDTSIFNTFNEVLENTKPKVKPGASHRVLLNDDDKRKSDDDDQEKEITASQAVNCLMGGGNNG